MNKKMLKKILAGKVLRPSDMTTKQKNDLYARLAPYGISPTLAYHRFFHIGFKAWEISGVTQLKKEFLIMASCGNGTGEDSGSRGYGYVLTLDPNYDDSQFYSMLSDLRIGRRFCDFMAAHGMTSQMTVRTRFKANDWKEWERIGIRSILSDSVAAPAALSSAGAAAAPVPSSEVCLGVSSPSSTPVPDGSPSGQNHHA